MSNFIDSLLKGAPWLQPVMAWSISLVIVFVSLTIPAYFIFWPFFERARTEVANFVVRLVQRFAANRRERSERLNSAADEFLKDGGLWRLNSEAQGQWSALATKFTRVLRKLRRPVGNAAVALDKVHKKVSSLQEELRGSDTTRLQTFPALPEYEEAVESTASLRVAILKMILATTILFALMLVNTGMLSQILRDLGVVPAGMMFAGVRLAYVFAFILTLVEAGLGVAHGSTRSDNAEKLSIFPFIMTSFAVILGFVEGFFYSRVAPTGNFSLPFLNYEMPQSNLFFFWGFVLVMTLFSLGFISFENFAKALRGTKAGTFKREMRKLQKRHDRLARAAKTSEEVLRHAKTASQEMDNFLQGPAANGESVREELDKVWKQIGDLKDSAPEWAKDKEATLSRSEVHQLAQKGGLWLTFASLGITVMTITGLNSFEAFNPNLKPTVLWVLAVGQSVVFFGVGFLLGTGETVVQGSGTERRVWAAPRLSTWCAYVVGALLVVTYIAVFFTVASPLGLGAIWFSNLVVGLFLIAAGYQLSPLLNVVRLWLWRVWNVIVLALEGLWLGLMRLLQMALAILENVSYLLAAPLDKLLRLLIGPKQAKIDRAEGLDTQTSSTPPVDTGSSSGATDQQGALTHTGTH